MANRKVKFDFDPLEGIDVELSSTQKSALLEDISNFVLESVLSDIGDSRSPVTGGYWKNLSPEYAAKKYGGEPRRGVKSNLELHGDLLDSIKVIRNGSKLRITVDESEQPKADGHNNFSGKSSLPRRPFIPDENRGENFRRDIRDGIEEVIKAFIEDEGLNAKPD